ncbi:alpha-ketoacid dehydrogenase subunit alpha/beta [Aciditerrimonas ferrireducens]|uniref:alpha-ketoacid dehydrogenase subunit alpha/beta n=1 Tax=Aciditerrimonas ferrireducens TaxID=667306 RepID=UPI0020056AFA|nr:alpha-ketoacid dehydrogenase subunit alpha/beta [Aciditerrimonas ferrireducens]MCK4177507.1 thiamine pyrophosphate-dependent enzyme [Aciditerrimonas ferrireducens]
MPTRHALQLAVPWERVEATEEDWETAEPGLLGTMWTQLVLVRHFEELVLRLAAEGLVHGPAHSSIGQEGGAVGSVLALAPGDTVTGSHRGHHQFLAKALAHVAPGGLDPVAPFPDEIRRVLLRTLAEICGLRRGWGGGRGGSMHLRWWEAGALGTNAIVGGGVPMAAGSAFCHRRAGTGAVTVTYLGDGAMNIGATLETLNLAAAWHLPLCFFVENNRYAVATTIEEATGEPRLSARGPGFGARSLQVDGMDPLATYLAMRSALEHLRAGDGPVLLEAETYRYYHQNGPFPGSAFRYRSREEEDAWRARDPLGTLAARMVARGPWSEDDLGGTRARAEALLQEVAEELFEPDPSGRPGTRRPRPSELPDPATVDQGIRSDLSELADAPLAPPEGPPGPRQTLRFVDAIAEVLRRRMAEDPRVLVLGEDVHRLGGGTNGATKGLAEAFPDRVLGTPISENAFCGLAGGMALDGRARPVVELMYADFLWVAADQLFNQIGKVRHMFGGDRGVPLVLRAKVAMGTGYGSQHSMDPAGIFATSAGWRIVAPSTPLDYVGLMNTALRLEDPVLVLEHVDLYPRQDEAPVEDWDFCLPLGAAAVRRRGQAVTVLGYLQMTHEVLQAVESTGVDAEVIDLRWLDRASLDWATIEASVQRTNRVLICEQGPLGPSWGAWVADELQRRCFDWLDAPIARVTGTVSSPTISEVLERAAIARAEEVARALVALTGGARA